MIQDDFKTDQHKPMHAEIYNDRLRALPDKIYKPKTSYADIVAIRIFDVTISAFLFIFLLPLLALIAILIKITSGGSIIFAQKRVGKFGEDFTLYKFRTMYQHSEEVGSLTIDSRDKRITGFGFFLRKHKLDELPQLWNVLKNEMSLVGPRPELRKYVNLYTAAQREMLMIKPGITDYASIEFRNENAILATHANAEEYYIYKILPHKIELNKKYAHNQKVKIYFIVIIKTFLLFFK